MDMNKQLRQPASQERMVRQQLIERGIDHPRVLEAMRSIPRSVFFPANLRDQACADRAAPIGHGQTISQPYIVGLMTQCLEIEATSKVLEIGTGSGYHTAILAKLAYEVYSIERVKPLLDEAFERLYSLNLRNVHFKYGDGLRGWQEFVPFDRILIAAGAPSLPRSLLLSQLADGGLAVLPVGPQDEQMLVQVRRKGDRLESTNLCPCRFVKLIGEGAWQE